ncbi:MAG: secondary thiamine-phosphate synthase enzyme YjbQ [Mariprofundaceae bacterium]
MRQAQDRISVACRGRGLYDVTRQVDRWVHDSGMQTGILTVFVPHTSCSLIVQENADPDVQHDLETFFARLAPDGDASYRHCMEGPDDMAAHIRSALTSVSLSIPVDHGRMQLGTWQGLYLYEHRHHNMSRQLVLHLVGD